MRKFIFLLLLVSLLVVGCGQADEPLEGVPTVAELEAATEEPTVETQAVDPQATDTPPPQLPTVERPTLPPVPTDTPPPTATDVPPTATPSVTAPPPATPLPACDDFRLNFAETTVEFPLGESPRVVWTPVQGAVQYRVRLWNIENRLEELTPPIFVGETSYMFEAFLFEAGERYGWAVYPIDARSQQMCLEIGDALIPTE